MELPDLGLYVLNQKKAFVRAALNFIEIYEAAQLDTNYPNYKYHKERIKEVTPKSRDPLDWSTEP